MNNTRVLHVITSLDRGGAQTSVVHIVKGLRARGIDAHLAFSSTGGARPGSPQPLAEEARRSGVPLHDVSAMRRSPSVFDAVAIAQMHQLIGTLQPAFVHTHASKAGLLGRAAARFARGRRRIVHSVRGWSWHGLSATTASLAVSIERQLSRITDHFLAVSHAMVAAGLHHGVGRVEDYSVIRSGIELSRFRRRARERSAVRAALGLGDEPLVGTVTRFSAAKAPLDFVAMASAVARAHPRVRFLMIGDGEDRERVQRAVAHSEHADRFLLLGERVDIPDLLEAMDVFVLTSRWEGMPRVVLEAAAAEVPIVATDVGGTREILDDGAGVLCPPGAVDQLAAAVLRLLADDPLRRRLVANARERVTAEFDITHVVEQHVQLYERLR